MSRTKVTINKIDVDINVVGVLEDFLPKAVEELKKRAPADTGEYKQGFTHEIKDNIGYVYNNGKHKSLAHILEFGTTRQEAQPHFVPTFIKEEKKFYEAMKNIEITVKKK